MIVYQATKSRFLEDAQVRDIEEIVGDVFMEKVGRRVGQSEVRSWRESLACMAKVLRDEGIAMFIALTAKPQIISEHTWQ